jgi:hypothetical protein
VKVGDLVEHTENGLIGLVIRMGLDLYGLETIDVLHWGSVHSWPASYAKVISV